MFLMDTPIEQLTAKRTWMGVHSFASYSSSILCPSVAIINSVVPSYVYVRRIPLLQSFHCTWTQSSRPQQNHHPIPEQQCIRPLPSLARLHGRPLLVAVPQSREVMIRDLPTAVSAPCSLTSLTVAPLLRRLLVLTRIDVPLDPRLPLLLARIGAATQRS